MDNHLVNILIADDEEGIRISLEWILELERYTVVIASNGLEAIENIKKHPCDIAFLDIRMPGMNGVEVFREIKKMYPKTIVILMTAYAINDMVREALQEGAYACLEKPLEMDEVIKMIKQITG